MAPSLKLTATAATQRGAPLTFNSHMTVGDANYFLYYNNVYVNIAPPPTHVLSAPNLSSVSELPPGGMFLFSDDMHKHESRRVTIT